MKEPHKEGVAIHLDPESCAGSHKGAGEALTGAHAGQPLSSEIRLSSRAPTSFWEAEGNTRGGKSLSLARDPAESKTLSMRENSRRENRETPVTPVAGKGRAGGRRP